MTIPFLSLFKRGKAPVAPKTNVRPVEPGPAVLEKPSSERLSKTVMPNATRTIGPQDPFEIASQSSANGGAKTAGPRMIAFDLPTPVVPPRDLPPAVALALEPRVERVIAVELADVFAQMPVDYLKPRESIDTTRRILLKAAEVEKGMANGKPCVSLASVYQQVPEIFLREVGPNDTTEVQLPFTKVLEQFAAMQVRPDQVRASAVPQFETPFLKVTLEDNARFGTTTEELHTGDLPPVRVQPPTAQAFAAAEPDASAGETYRAPVTPDAPAPARIAFKLSPKGTDALAKERVPAAAGGPSVPTSFSEPTRIPFKMSSPAEDLRRKPEPWLTAASSEFAAEIPAPPAARENHEVKISLALKPILQALPAFQLSGDPNTVPDDVLIELPFSLIEPQLASGRVTIAPDVFHAGVPVNFRSVFNPSEASTDVALPLQEVLKNLPGASLRMREDQEEQEAGANFATPFSKKAEEDAKRFKVAGKPVAKQKAVPVPAKKIDVAPVAEATAPVTEVAPPVPPPAVPSADRPPRNPLQVALDTDEKVDAKGVVALVNKMPGIKGCAILFGDGLSLAGTLPEEFETEGLCAMAPSLLQRIENHMVETKLGALRGLTLSCTKASVTFFMHENLCLAALHAVSDLAPEIREKLARIVHELSRKYSHPV